MNPPALVLFAAAILAAMLFPVAFLTGGMFGAQGYGMGLFGTAFSVIILKLTVGLAASASGSQRAGKGSVFIVLAFLIKLPLFVGLAFMAHRLGGAAEPWFLGGLGLVYCALIGWAVAKR